jgi:hypothetical protein
VCPGFSSGHFVFPEILRKLFESASLKTFSNSPNYPERLCLITKAAGADNF